MGRGSSKSGGGGNSKSKITTQQGQTIDLDSPLVYGKLDNAISAAQRSVLETQETKKLKSIHEHAIVVDAQGNQITPEMHGSSRGMRIPVGVMNTPDGIFTHNHPRGGKDEKDLIGGTFSGADLNTFATSGIKTIRASAAEGTYSMSKGPKFNSSAFQAFAKSAERKSTAKFKANDMALAQDMYAKKIDYNTYKAQRAKAFNNMLVDFHNTLLAGQGQYGYTYTLEVRK